MAQPDYIPAKDADLDAWALNFSTLITAAPTAYGLVSGQATTFATLRTAFTNSLLLATDPPTRTPVTVAAKDTARALLVTNARQLAAIVQGFPAITPTQLAALGLTVRQTIPTPIPAPVTQPVLSIIGNAGQVVTFNYHDSTTPLARAKPYGVIGVQVQYKLGATPPSGWGDGVMAATFGRSPYRVVMPPTAVGQIVHFNARYVTRRGLVGPINSTVTTVVAA
ncbi:MAG TPA: hypothetical protein PJ982_11750 [Lacipirellulaceae bacterium]|nr:hypothetical protein [Lacipirellulaceae bacterium]